MQYDESKFSIISLVIFFNLNLQLDGATYRTSQKCSAGGVGRNLAEGLLKLHGNVEFISKVGADQVNLMFMHH